MSPPALPPAVRRTLIGVTPPMVLVAAVTNYDHLLHLGRAIGMGRLDWSMPIAVIVYEIISTGVFFLTPGQHKGLRRSAAFGAVAGILLTMALSALWQSIDDGAIEVGLGLKLVLVPVPSLVGAAFLHMLVLASGAHAEAPEAVEDLEAEADAEADAVIAALRPEAEAARAEAPVAPPAEAPKPEAAPEAPAPVEAEADSAPAAPEAPEADSAPEAPQPEAPVLPVPVPVAAASAPPRRPRVTAVLPPRPRPEAPEAVKLPRVAPEHVEKALEILRREVEAGKRPEAVKSGQVLHEFRKYQPDIGDRTVRDALRVGRFQLEMEARKQLLPV